MTDLLRVQALTVEYGGLTANEAIDLTIPDGSLVGLIGPNGAGKTTFIDALTGFVPSSGKIEFAGSEISGLPAHARARAGLARTWQSLELFDDLNTRDNLRVAVERQSAMGFLLDLVRPRRHRDMADIDFALDVLGISELGYRMPHELDQGQRKTVGTARALAARPKLICMDEPGAGLGSGESAQLGARLRAIVDAGVTILLVDHNMGLVLDVCDYVYVIDFGRNIAEGTPAEIRRDPEVIAAYLGGVQTDGRP